MKDTTVENTIKYIVTCGYLKTLVTKDRLLAYETFDKLKKNSYTNIVLKKVTTNVETEYLQRG